MSMFQTFSPRRAAAALATAAVLAGGLMTTTASMAASEFDTRYSAVIAQVLVEPGYKPIPLESKADRVWFYEHSQALFKKKISKEQYVSDGNKEFPGNEASFSELANLFTAP